MNKSVVVANWRHMVQGVRAVLELEAFGVLSGASVEAFIAQWVHLGEAVSDVKKKQYIAWILLANLPFIRFDTKPLFHKLSIVSTEGLPDLADLIQLNSVPFSLKSELLESQAHDLPPLNLEGLVVDPTWDPTFLYMTIFQDTFEPDESAEINFKKWNTILNLRQVFESFELNHPRLAETLLNVPSETVGHPEKIVAEFLFGELLRTRRNGIKQVLYEVVLMDCCRITRLFPPVMARALLALSNRLETLDWVQQDALASWFAHHLSNFDYKWKWDEWREVIDLAEAAPKRLFVTSILEKLVRLSYYERVSEAVPEWCKVLLPPVAEFVFEEKEGTSVVLEAIQSRCSHEHLRSLLFDAEGKPITSARSILISCLLMAGSKTFSHAVILIERYLPVLQELHPKGDLAARLETIDAAAHFWKQSVQHIEFVLERLTHYRIISSVSVIQWIVQTTELFVADGNSVFGVVLNWNLVSTAMYQARVAPVNIQTRIDALAPEDFEAKTRMETIKANLEQECQECLSFAMQRFTELPANIVADADTTASISTFCSGVIGHISN